MLEEPEIIRQGQQYGVKLKASAPSLHIMKVDVETEVRPIVGSEQQSSELVNSMLGDFENDKQAIWDTNIFGRSLSSLVADGINNKLINVPADAELKLKKLSAELSTRAKAESSAFSSESESGNRPERRSRRSGVFPFRGFDCF